MRLRLYESVIAFRFVFSPRIRGPAIFDFCNKIGPDPMFAAMRHDARNWRRSGLSAGAADAAWRDYMDSLAARTALNKPA
jgi:hypothetical protein